MSDKHSILIHEIKFESFAKFMNLFLHENNNLCVGLHVCNICTICKYRR